MTLHETVSTDCPQYMSKLNIVILAQPYVHTSISLDGDHPDLVNICIQILPPTVIWPEGMDTHTYIL